ncbi:DUF4412 domain-containing protein [Holophaga foetida]|uniref:DUF4412 domain-containing protein n=1 Tax=Holophaga foetida TaxID=35839 RepID=UPI0002474D92|nr:DUF4412 domain-containing protein [Holophaga foetida]
MRRLALLALGLLFSAITLGATDLTIAFKVEGKSLMGGKTTTETHYYTSKYQMVRNESSKTDSLVDYEKATTYTIDHDKKKIAMMRMDDALAAMESMDQQSPGAMKGVMGAMFGDASKCTVEKMGTEAVAGRTCTIHKITVGKLVMVMSADPSLSAPVPAASYSRMMKARAATMAKAGPSAASFKRLYEEMSKIKGLPLKTRMSGFLGMNALSEATQIKAGPISGAIFALPAYPIEDAGKQLREEISKGKKK